LRRIRSRKWDVLGKRLVEMVDAEIEKLVVASPPDHRPVELDRPLPAWPKQLRRDQRNAATQFNLMSSYRDPRAAAAIEHSRTPLLRDRGCQLREPAIPDG
jgi:hypothetical protein